MHIWMYCKSEYTPQPLTNTHLKACTLICNTMSTNINTNSFSRCYNLISDYCASYYSAIWSGLSGVHLLTHTVYHTHTLEGKPRAYALHWCLCECCASRQWWLLAQIPYYLLGLIFFSLLLCCTLSLLLIDSHLIGQFVQSKCSAEAFLSYS